MYNLVVLTGRPTKDPEMKYVNEKGVTVFSLAVNRSYGDKTDFVPIECWNRGNYKLAEYVGNDVRKGKLITVVGELRIDKHNDKYYTKVVADKVIYEKEQTNNSNQNNSNNDLDIDESGFSVPF